MKTKLLILSCLFLANAVFGQVTFTNVIPTAHATLITNRTLLYNTTFGTSLTVSNAVDKFGIINITNTANFSAIINREKEKRKIILYDAYFKTNAVTRASVNSALGIVP